MPSIHVEQKQSSLEEDNQPIDKMKIIRSKMETSRKIRENQPAGNLAVIRKRESRPKMFNYYIY